MCRKADFTGETDFAGSRPTTGSFTQIFNTAHLH
jgi:hypothetical protein